MRRSLRWIVPFLALVAFFPGRAAAQLPYFWDGGTGNWDTTSNLWHPGSTGGVLTTWPNSGLDSANFGSLGSAGTVSLTFNIAPTSTNFTQTGYTLQTNGATRSLNSPIVLSNNVNLNLLNSGTTGGETLNIGGSISGGTNSRITIRGAQTAGNVARINISTASAAVST